MTEPTNTVPWQEVFRDFKTQVSYNQQDVMLSWCKGYLLALDDLMDDIEDCDTMQDLIDLIARIRDEAARTVQAVLETGQGPQSEL